MHVLIIPSERYATEEEPLAGIFQRDQALALKRNGFNVGIIAPRPRSLRFFRAGMRAKSNRIEITELNGIPVYRCLSWSWIPARTPYIFTLLFRSHGMRFFSEYVKEHGVPDLIHAHNCLYAGVLAAQIKRVHGIPFVLTEHSSRYLTGGIRRWQRQLVRDALNGASIRCVVSNYLGESLEQDFPGTASPWERVPNILAPLFEAQPPIGAGNPHPEGVFRFLTVGSMVAIKNHAGLLRSFARQFAEDQHVQLRIGGDGPLRAELMMLAQTLGISSQVAFLGRLARSEVLAEMQASNAFVLSSNHETFGVVLIEALACGMPVIATACGGPAEIVCEANGILVPTRDEPAMAHAMSVLMERYGEYDREAIRRECLQLFGEAAIVESLGKVYGRAANNEGVSE